MRTPGVYDISERNKPMSKIRETEKKIHTHINVDRAGIGVLENRSLFYHVRWPRIRRKR